MSAANEIRGVIAKWTARGYIEPGVATDIADDLLGIPGVSDSEQQLANERAGRDIERRALIAATERITLALEICAEAEANPWSSPQHWAEQVRFILNGGAA